MENEPIRQPIRILLVDDHVLVRKGISAMLERRTDMRVVGEAADGEEAVALTLSLKPDVIVMDLVMPRKSGIDAIGEIKKLYPQANILVLTSFDQDDKVFPAIKAGAVGYLIKDSTPEELVQAILKTAQGVPSLQASIAMKLIRDLSPGELPSGDQPLTEREILVLKRVARGYSNQEIARELSISERTVSTHVGNILEKLHLANRTQAALYALRHKLADLGEDADS
jgi:two-component system, NarL family, response regulator LiaR